MKIVKPWIVEGQKTVYECRLFRIFEKTSRSAFTGQVHSFFTLSAQPWVNVVALTPEGRVVLVRQFRHGSGKVTLEIPGGAVDANEAPQAAAIRELREETGYAAAEWRHLGTVEPNPAIQENLCHTFLAMGAVKVGGPEPDDTEEIEVETLKLEEVPDKIASGEICHALVVSAFYFLNAWQDNNKRHGAFLPWADENA